MKSLVVFLGAICLIFNAGLSFAQSAGTGVHLSADIPFAFVVEHTTLPAGHYTVRSFGASDGKTLQIQSSDQRWTATVRTHGVYAPRTPQHANLRFLALGEKHFLWEIWMPGNQLGNQMAKNPEALEMESSHRRATVEVAAERLH